MKRIEYKIMNSSNRHLKSKIDEVNNFIRAHNNPPKDLYDSFLLELGVSQLYIPAIREGEDVVFEHLESDDGVMILQLFTTPDEYGGENELMNFEFSFYAEIIADCDFDGAVINPQSDEVYVQRRFTEDLRVKPLPKVDDDEMYGPDELRKIGESVRNEKLVSFIRNDSNFNNFDGLISILSESIMLNVVSSREDLSQFANDGIISNLEVGGMSLSVKSEGREKFGLLFTDIGAIRDTCDTTAGLHYYYQITSFDKILRSILVNDLDGLIINPNIDDYYVPRNVLLDIYVNHPEITYNPKLLAGTFFVFEL